MTHYLTINDLHKHYKMDIHIAKTLLNAIYNEKIYNGIPLKNMFIFPNGSITPLVKLHIPEIGVPEYRLNISHNPYHAKLIINHIINMSPKKSQKKSKSKKIPQKRCILLPHQLAKYIKSSHNQLSNALIFTLNEDVITSFITKRNITLTNYTQLSDGKIYPFVDYYEDETGKTSYFLKLPSNYHLHAEIIRNFAKMNHLPLVEEVNKRNTPTLSSNDLKRYIVSTDYTIQRKFATIYNQYPIKECAPKSYPIPNNTIVLKNGTAQDLIVLDKKDNSFTSFFLQISYDKETTKEIINHFAKITGLKVNPDIDKLLTLPFAVTSTRKPHTFPPKTQHENQ